jgi:hypothetical protein
MSDLARLWRTTEDVIADTLPLTLTVSWVAIFAAPFAFPFGLASPAETLLGVAFLAAIHAYLRGLRALIAPHERFLPAADLRVVYDER